jgi:hypothetical protein
MKYLLLIVLIALAGCTTTNPAYRDCSGISHDRWTGMTHPDMNY